MARSKKKILFVDGYNVMNGWAEIAEVMQEDLEAAREMLIDRLAEYKSLTQEEVVLVFDAHLVKGNISHIEFYKGIKVVYTKENETADRYIERELDELGRFDQVRVASSDATIQQIILGRGGTRVSAQEIIAELRNMRETLRRKKRRDLRLVKRNMVTLDEETLELLDEIMKNMDDGP
jgi:predicted RNA-binding protein with PIN domain